MPSRCLFLDRLNVDKTVIYVSEPAIPFNRSARGHYCVICRRSTEALTLRHRGDSAHLKFKLKEGSSEFIFTCTHLEKNWLFLWVSSVENSRHVEFRYVVILQHWTAH